MKNAAYFFIVAISIVVILVYGKGLIIPFIFALLLWFAVREIKALLDRIPVLQRYVPNWAKYLITFAAMLGVLVMVSTVLSSNVNELAQAYPSYEANVDVMVERINSEFNINVMDMLKGQTNELDFGTILASIFNSITDIMGSAFMILIYALFIFTEETFFKTKVRNVFPDSQRFEKFSVVMEAIDTSISKYLGLKTVVSLITGILSYVTLFFIGIDSPVFWAALIFLLNYIPTIGSLIGTLFPTVFCLLQFGEFTPALLVLLLVGAIQLLVGNVLEPRLMGNSMNLSPLVTILALSFWGAIWGVTGMILSIPITVSMVIVFAQFPSTRNVAILLSEKGTVE
ncbi:MAG: AI-2E family transporter [Salibacteraceae bacterium]